MAALPGLVHSKLDPPRLKTPAAQAESCYYCKLQVSEFPGAKTRRSLKSCNKTAPLDDETSEEMATGIEGSLTIPQSAE